MRTVKRFLSACRAALLTLFMPGATQDETTKPQEQIPSEVVRPRNYPGELLPEDNPIKDPNAVYERMGWYKRHGWYDYE